MTEFVEKLAADIPAKPEDKALVIDFYKAALVGMTLDWVNSGMKQDPESLIKRLGSLFGKHSRGIGTKCEFQIGTLTSNTNEF